MKRLRYSLLLLVLMAFKGLYGQESPHPSLLFIFDASGSMWQKMENSTKIQIAKQTMEVLCAKIPPHARVGLVAYGHTSTSDCQDIETLIPFGPFDPVEFISTVKNLNPKGKTPIALSISHALEHLKPYTEPVSLILISDGLETCEGNACEVIRKAKQAGRSLTMHVIGFGIGESDQSSLECLAQAGGGLYVPAENAQDLDLALSQSIKEIPVGDAFLAVQTTVGGILKDASVKIIRKNNASENFSGRTYSKPETNPRIFQLEPGIYDIQVTLVGAQGQSPVLLSDVEIQSKDTVRKVVDFQQGVFEILVTRNGELSDATIQIFPSGSGKVIATTRSYTKPEHNPARLKVSPGVYDIVIGSVEISGRPEIKMESKPLAAGSNLKFSHNFQSGELSIGARQGAVLVDATISILDEHKKIIASGRTYSSPESNPKKFTLQPGIYTIELRPVKSEGLDQKSLSVEIRAGETIEKVGVW